MMAEAYRVRGLQSLDNANLMRGSDQEKEFLTKARDSFNEALKTYMQVTPWGNSTTQILSIQASLTEIDRRMQLLSQPNPLLPWTWFK